MSVDRIVKPSTVRGWIHRFGIYAGVRHAKNKNVPFAIAYYAVFGRLPTR